MSTRIDVKKLQEGLQTRRLGKKIFFTQSVSSTNDWSKELATFGAQEGTVAIAQTQTAGRGRVDREWISPDGGLWFSLVLRPKIPAKNATALVFVAGLAVAETLRECYGLRVETKWPNDVLVNMRKICGILTEMKTTGEKINYVSIGIGLNANLDVEKVFPAELKKTVTSLEKETGKKIRLEGLFRALMQKLETLYDLFLNEGSTAILLRWKKYASFLGCQVDAENESETLSGVAYDVNNDGALILKLTDGTIKEIHVGDIPVRTTQTQAS